MKKIGCMISFLLLFSIASSYHSYAVALKPRIVVLTDISTWEPDDMESMIRLLVHADLFEIEGLVFTTGWSLDKTRDGFIDLIHDAIDAYEQDLPNLRKRSKQDEHLQDETRQAIGYWPSPDYLRSCTVYGSKVRGFKYIGESNRSPGSDWIVRVVDEEDERPVWVTVWGGGNTLAQAIWQVQQERDEKELKTFLQKIRVYAITDQDRGGDEAFEISSHQWMRREFKKDLLFFWDENAWKYHNYLGKTDWDAYAEHIQNHGHLGKLYPKYRYGVEGDTPAFLHLIPNGLNDPGVPTHAGWGGYFEWGKGGDNETYAYTNHQGTAKDISTKYFKQFYPAAFHNFAARMDWAKDGMGNRNPVVIVNDDDSLEVITVSPTPGEAVTLDASNTYDPDDDTLVFSWWVLSEAGTYTDSIEIQNKESSRATVQVPTDSAGETFHVICEVRDNGVHNLSSYRRIIFAPVR